MPTVFFLLTSGLKATVAKPGIPSLERATGLAREKAFSTPTLQGNDPGLDCVEANEVVRSETIAGDGLPEERPGIPS